MTEQNPENDVQDPAEQYEVGKSVETNDQPEPTTQDVVPGNPDTVEHSDQDVDPLKGYSVKAGREVEQETDDN